MASAIQRRLEVLAVTTWFLICHFGFITNYLLCFYLLSTRFYWISIATFLWIYFDYKTSETGGRPIIWIQNLPWWTYIKNYFSSTLLCVPDFHLDPTRNYLFCCFPHGVVAVGPFVNIASKASGFHQLFPNCRVTIATTKLVFWCPLFRELALACGLVSCSAKSLDHILGSPGNNAVILWIGGKAEMWHSKPGEFKIVLRGRKGFVKLALKHGTPLVPVFTFGENDLFEPVDFPVLRPFQEAVRKYFGCVTRIFRGRWWVIPKRRRLSTVVGKPINVVKSDNPTDEEINTLHQKFVEQLQSLFEAHKERFLEDSNKTLEFS